MKRRTFISTAALAAAAGPSLLTLEGCSFGSVMAELGKYLPIGLQALAGIASLISPAAGAAISALIGLINAAWGGLQAAVNAYNSAPAADKQTALQKVLEALDAVQSTIAQTTTALGVGGTAIVKAAEAALLLITTTLASIEAQLAPQAPAVASVHAAHAAAHPATSVQTGGTTLQIDGKPQHFKASYNLIMVNAGRSDLKLN